MIPVGKVLRGVELAESGLGIIIQSENSVVVLSL